MIKLIASDLDGTLLQNGSQSISLKMIEIIEKLHEKGIVFVAASGRQYPNLYRLFHPVSEHMAFICENGGLVMYQNQIVSATPMSRELGLELMADIQGQEGCEFLLSGQNTSYICPKSEEYVYRMKHIVKNNVCIIDSPAAVTEDFLKISIYESAGIHTTGDYFVNKWQDTFKSTISGNEWLDFTAPSVNKGSAMKTLLEKLSISASETMAFGDNYNDLEMLSLVKYGYVMENADNEIKSRYIYRSKLVEDTITEVIL